MSITLALALWLATVSVALAIRARTAPRHIRRHLAYVERYGLAARSGQAGAGAAPAATGRDAKEIVTSIGGRVALRVSPKHRERIRRDLLSAGRYDETPEAFLGMQAVTTVGALLLALMLVGMTGAGPLMSIALVALATYVGLVLPAASLSRRARTRLDAIDREMPELVDLLVVAIEAGLGLFAALDRATARMNGPLRDELRLVLREQGLGASSAEALGRFGDRCDTVAVRSFSRTLVQGERLGASVGQSMRALAVDMRKRRQADAEQRAQKMPIKILFPLVFCIFPAMFVVLLAPAAMRIFDGLG